MPRTPLMVICSLIIFLIISSVYPSQNTSDTGQQYTDTLIGFQIPYTDSQIVRIFLDTNGLNNIPVNQVAKFRDSKAISIDIKEKNITIVPDLIGQLYDIETINLYGNSIDSIPASICQLRLLRSLVLARNKLTHLPEDIGEIDSLYSLHVETNMLINIPASIGKLKKLRYLALTENRLTSLPKEIGNLSDLQTLWLVKNNIQSLPQEIGQLKSLKELFAWDNKLTSIPKELSTLSSLEHGAFGNNLLTSIPVEICTLPKVSRLEFTGNKIVSIPADFFKLPFLSRVEFGYNCLTSIPSTILARTFSTYYVDFGSNKLCTVSDSITAWLNKYDSDWKKTQECGNTKIVYVKQSASGANNGTSWSNAFRKLQDALSIVSYGDEIWVAEGTYKPTDTINQSRSFVLGTGISLYGGFSGTETSREERSFSRYKSILTGDILNNDFCFKYMNDNVYHVVHNNGKAKLDGFLIRGGEANDSRDYYGHGCDFTNLYGGGVYADGDSLVIANCIFTGNSASTRNGFQDSLMGTPSGCGGAIAIWSGDVRIENSLFVNNYADSGGAIFLSRGRVNIINSTFYNNAASEGGAIYNQFRMILSNTILWNNSASRIGKEIYNEAMNLTDDGTSLILYNNIIKNRTDSKYLTNVFGVGLIDSGYNSASDPLFLNSSNPFGTDNIPGTSDDGLLLTVNSPCIDRGTANNMPQKDLIGTLRPQGNAPDIGAYEYASFAVTTIEKLNDNYSNDYIISPNPFNPNVTVYSLKENASSMSIYNSLGKMVITLNSIRDKSNICFKWDGKNSAGKKMPSGIYFARIKTSSRTDAIKLFLSR